MKMMKKLTTLMLTICLLISCYSMPVFAADGKIMFTDPQTKAGEVFEVTGVVQKTAGNFGKIEIAMKYDTSMLKFKSGEGITESEAGQLTYIGDATNDTGSRKEFKLSFTALKEGTTKIEITSATIKNVLGTVLNYTKGSSTVTIAKGEETTTAPTTTTTVTTTEATVEVNGVSYKIANEFPKDVIPVGYEAAKLDYDLVEYDVVYSEGFDLYLAYLVNEENAGDFFMYVEEDATFAPYEEIRISDSVTIVLLSDATEVVLPEEYKTTTVVLNGHDFPAWRDADSDAFCILYAINNYGEKSLYQLDNIEGTYQRFVAPELNEEFPDNSLIGKLSTLLENHLDYVILGTGLGFLFLLLVIIILSVKLYNRNAELDEIYDEYDIISDKTEDDVVLDLDEEDDEEDDEEEEDITEEELNEVTQFVQDELRELVQKSVEESTLMEEKELTKEIILEIPEAPAKKSAEELEDSFAKALENVTAQNAKKTDLYDDDDIFENFSVDFIDLDEE